MSMFKVICGWSRGMSHRCIANIFQFHLDLRKNDSSMSWYPSFLHLLCACQVVPIGGIYVSFCQNILMLCRPHCLANGFWVKTFFLLGNCAVWIRLWKTFVQEDSWEALLILNPHHINTGGILIFSFIEVIGNQPVLYGFQLKSSPFSTGHFMWVKYKVVSQLSQPIFFIVIFK